MKKYIKLTIILSLLITSQILCALPEASSWEEYVEEIEKNFDFQTNSPEIWVNNIYGNVNIISSERSDAKVEVKITVEAKNKSRADEIFGKIDIDFTDTPNSLKASTHLNGNSHTKNNEHFKIDYTIYLPIKTSLSIENKYGDISLSKHSNDVEISLQYGSGNVQDIDGDFTIDLAYADRFDGGSTSGDLNIKVAYSKLSLEDAHKIDCRTSYSTLSFGSSSSLDLNSQYDSFSIEDVDDFDVTAKYSNFSVARAQKIDFDFDYTTVKIKELSHQGAFDSDYGNVTINSLGSEARSIDIDAEHTEYTIYCGGNVNLDIDTKYTLVKYPRDLKVSHKEKDNNELILKGSRGTGGVSIVADMQYGSLLIRD